jgi:hypothetical protein
LICASTTYQGGPDGGSAESGEQACIPRMSERDRSGPILLVIVLKIFYAPTGIF